MLIAGDRVIYRRRENLNSFRRGKFIPKIKEWFHSATVVQVFEKVVLIEIDSDGRKIKKRVDKSTLTKEVKIHVG